MTDVSVTFRGVPLFRLTREWKNRTELDIGEVFGISSQILDSIYWIILWLAGVILKTSNKMILGMYKIYPSKLFPHTR